ncbi:MAG: ornithine carbamoyltransferase [Acidimicrobiaceae bacterium]|jgi:ornithine carbamoyltransferase|nr:ornithine carbamoyltransferase [Acidimicrobiaceae bacterium]
MTDVLRISDLGPDGLASVLELASAPAPQPLAGRGVALLFEYPSARTRNACEMAVVQLGGHPVTIRGEEVGLDKRETVEDVARTLACFHDLIGARVASHETLSRMAGALRAAGSPVPVVNLLSDLEHPTQAVADLLTVEQEFGGLAGRTVAYIGDANNVCRSLVEACLMSGMGVRVASPDGFGPTDEDLERTAKLGGDLRWTNRPEEAAEGADVLYTDVWVSMGDGDAEERRRAFTGFTIDERLLDIAGADAVLLHCLPAHRGEEVTEAALEGPRSRVWRQAANRMHGARAVFAYALGVRPGGPATAGEAS